MLETLGCARLTNRIDCDSPFLAVLAENPFQNPPPYEKLVGDLVGAYSRRINFQHRLVYQVLSNIHAVNDSLCRNWLLTYWRNNCGNAICEEAAMTKPELFDVIELLVDLPEYNLRAGVQGAIVECYSDGKYEVEFTNSDGETLALTTLSSEQFIVVWKAKTKSWLSVSEQVGAVITQENWQSDELKS